MIFFPLQSNEILLVGQTRFCAGQNSPRHSSWPGQSSDQNRSIQNSKATGGRARLSQHDLPLAVKIGNFRNRINAPARKVRGSGDAFGLYPSLRGAQSDEAIQPFSSGLLRFNRNDAVF
jgi:hypothetical protein